MPCRARAVSRANASALSSMMVCPQYRDGHESDPCVDELRLCGERLVVFGSHAGPGNRHVQQQLTDGGLGATDEVYRAAMERLKPGKPHRGPPVRSGVFADLLPSSVEELFFGVGGDAT